MAFLNNTLQSLISKLLNTRCLPAIQAGGGPESKIFDTHSSILPIFVFCMRSRASHLNATRCGSTGVTVKAHEHTHGSRHGTVAVSHMHLARHLRADLRVVRAVSGRGTKSEFMSSVRPVAALSGRTSGDNRPNATPHGTSPLFSNFVTYAVMAV